MKLFLHTQTLFKILLFLLFVFTGNSQAQFSTSVEMGLAGFTRNEARIPNDTGTKIDFTKLNGGKQFVFRFIPSFKFKKHHEIRGLWAPLTFDVDGKFTSSKSFNGKSFASGVDTSASYKFNSYRLGYIYHFNPSDSLRWRLGFIAKIRDAHVSIKQGALKSKKSNVGFVPLIHLGMTNDFNKKLSINVDIDALGASQGRAIDALIALKYKMQPTSYGAWNFYTGYRTIEGGADTDSVYNFAWIHQGVIGVELVQN